MTTPTPDLAEANPNPALSSAEAILRNWAGGASFYVTREAVQAVMGEYDRRGERVDRWRSRAVEAEARVDGQAWADLEAERDRLRDELTQMRVYYTTLIMDVVDAAGWTGESFSGLGDHIATLAAHCTPGAPPASGQFCHNCDEKIRRCPYAHPEYGFTCAIPSSHAGPHFDLAGGHWNEDGQVKAWGSRGNRGRPLASPGADTPAEPTGVAALLALCDALDRLPASEGGSGPTLAVDEIRRLLGAPAGAGQLATKLRADTHQDRADRLAIALMRLRDVVDQLIREDREVENSNRCGESVEFDDGKGFTCALPNGHDGEHDVERRPGYLGASS